MPATAVPLLVEYFMETVPYVPLLRSTLMAAGTLVLVAMKLEAAKPNWPDCLLSSINVNGATELPSATPSGMFCPPR